MFLQNAYAGTTIQLPQASTVAGKIDYVTDLVFWSSVVFFILIVAGIAYFIRQYHRSRKGRVTAYILGHHGLEAAWTFIPLVFMLIIFVYGFVVFKEIRAVPADAYEINVYGRQWLWNFEYTNGRKTMNELVVPKDKPVKLIMTSEDVLHSFYIPNFRLKQDVVPGAYNYLSFIATMSGEHPLYCAEFCGTGHSDMLGKVFVLEQPDFDKWLASGRLPANLVAHRFGGMSHSTGSGISEPASGVVGAKKSLAEKGKDVFMSKGCFACHSTDGSPKVGPSFLHAYGRVEELQDGSKVTVDENYIRESIMDPQKKIVKGYPPSMPTFRGLLSDEEVNALVAYIKSLK
ncbi:MAG: cytochrome c oxidase subunit II [Bacteriovoracia bacterium]